MMALEIRCNGCKKVPEDIGEYVHYAKAENAYADSPNEYITPTQYVQDQEGTYNPENGHFLCTECYINAGMPSSRWGWKAP